MVAELSLVFTACPCTIVECGGGRGGGISDKPLMFTITMPLQ